MDGNCPHFKMPYRFKCVGVTVNLGGKGSQSLSLLEIVKFTHAHTQSLLGFSFYIQCVLLLLFLRCFRTSRPSANSMRLSAQLQS